MKLNELKSKVVFYSWGAASNKTQEDMLVCLWHEICGKVAMPVHRTMLLLETSFNHEITK